MFNFLFNFIYYVLVFVIAAFFLLLGIIGMILPWADTVRTDLIQFILENTLAIGLFGFGFFLIGLGVLVNLFLRTRKRYYHLRIGQNAVVLDEALIRQYVHSYWKQLFPSHEIPTQFALKKDKIKIIAELPRVSKTEQELLLAQIKQDLHEIFSKVLGYSQELVLSISFSR